MSTTNLISSGTTAREKVNLRTPDVMAAVQEQVEQHYRSDIVDKVHRAGGIIKVGDTTVRLAKQFGFCYGVERAIDLAYAARKVFKERRLFIVGEIIHNPEVNHQIAALGIKNLTGRNKQADISDLQPEDIVIVPAFGTELSMLQQIKERGCQIVDTTCGDVMSANTRASRSRRSFTAKPSMKKPRRPVRARLGTGKVITWSCSPWPTPITFVITFATAATNRRFSKNSAAGIRPGSIRTCISKLSGSRIKPR